MIKDLSRDERHIGLVANDDIETYASIFALWLEGKAYVPLHPNQPLDRCEEIIKQININTVLDSGETTRFLKNNVIKTSALAAYEKDLLTNDVDQSRLCFERGVHLKEAIVNWLLRIVEEHFNDTESVVNRIQQCSVALFRIPQRLFCLFPLSRRKLKRFGGSDILLD